MSLPHISGPVWLGIALLGVACIFMGLFKHFLVLVACAYVMVWGVADHSKALTVVGLLGVIAVAIAGAGKLK